MRWKALVAILLAVSVLLGAALMPLDDGEEGMPDWDGEVIQGGIDGPDTVTELGQGTEYRLVDPEALEVMDGGGTLDWNIDGPERPFTSLDWEGRSYEVHFNEPGWYTIEVNVTRVDGDHRVFSMEVDVRPDGLSFQLVEVGRWWNGSQDRRSGDLFITMLVHNSWDVEKRVHQGEFHLELEAKGSGTTGWFPYAERVVPRDPDHVIVVDAGGSNEATLFFDLAYNTEVDALKRQGDGDRGYDILLLDYPGGGT